MKIGRNGKIAVAVYFLSLGAYLGASNTRLRAHSNDNHYVRLADGWLHGRLDLGPNPPNIDDRAQVETLYFRDDRPPVRGAFVTGTTQAFRTLKGEILSVRPDEIARRETRYYISFPPFPAVLMLPMVAVAGLNANDVVFNCVVAAFAPALLFLLLRKLRARGDSQRSEREDLWLAAILAVGSVFYYASVIGQVWYTAHVVSVNLVILYVLAALDAKHPFWAGLCVVCGFLCRPEILFTAPLFLWELVRVNLAPSEEAAAGGWRARLADGWRRLDKRAAFGGLVRFGAPIAALGLVAAGLNVVRFGRPTEFGHTYLVVRWTPRIQKYGLFNYTFLGRNLACLLALTPKLVAGPPFIQSSYHGLAIWVTTPVVLYLLWPSVKGPLHRPLWLTTACVAIPDLLYQNSGWIQFGYRFALDYFVFLICLLAIGGRPMTRRFKILILIGIAVNLFGALTFGRAWQFYYDGYFPPGID